MQNVRLMRTWTQATLAKEAGVNPTTVSRIQTGKIGRPHFGTLGSGSSSWRGAGRTPGFTGSTRAARSCAPVAGVG